MIKVPNLNNVYERWNISSINWNKINNYIDTTVKNYSSKINSFIKQLKDNEPINCLTDYFNFASREDAYIVHMELAYNPNIIVNINNGQVTYSYSTSEFKDALGVPAYGLVHITKENLRYFRKRFKTSNDTIFLNTLFVLNNLIDLSIHQSKIFNIINLSKSLAMKSDDLLIALTILIDTEVLNIKSTALSEEFEFTMNEYFNSYIQDNVKEQIAGRNIFDIKLDINELNKLVNESIQYIKNHSRNGIYTRVPILNNNPEMCAALRFELAHNDKIAFIPSNFDSDKRVLYHYYYLDNYIKHENDKKNEVAYRFIPVNMTTKCMQVENLSANIYDTLWILDYVYRMSRNNIKIVKFNSSILKIIGFYNLNHVKDNFDDLVKMNAINIIDFKFSNTRIVFNVELTDYSLSFLNKKPKFIQNNVQVNKPNDSDKIDKNDQSEQSNISEQFTIKTDIDNSLIQPTDIVSEEATILNEANLKLLMQISKMRDEMKNMRAVSQSQIIDIVSQAVEKYKRNVVSECDIISNFLPRNVRNMHSSKEFMLSELNNMQNDIVRNLIASL